MEQTAYDTLDYSISDLMDCIDLDIEADADLFLEDFGNDSLLYLGADIPNIVQNSNNPNIDKVVEAVSDSYTDLHLARDANIEDFDPLQDIGFDCADIIREAHETTLYQIVQLANYVEKRSNVLHYVVPSSLVSNPIYTTRISRADYSGNYELQIV